MHTFKKFAVLALISAGVAAPLAAHAANNEDTYKPAPAHKMVVSKAEVKAPDFAAIDADHSGKITLKEFVANSGAKETHTKAKAEFAALDKNHDKVLTSDEFSGKASM